MRPLYIGLIQFFVVLVVDHAHGLVCLGNDSLSLLHSELLAHNDSPVLHSFYRTTRHSSFSNTACHLMICTDDKNVTLDFSEESNRSGNYVGFTTWFPLSKENSSIVSCVEYVCSAEDLCDRAFAEKWTTSFARVRQDTVQDKLITLLTDGKASSQCDSSEKSVNCPSGVCVLEYTGSRNHSMLGTGCADDSSSTQLELFMKMQSVEFRSIEFKELQYVCRKDSCNDEPTFQRVWNETAGLFKSYKPIVVWLRRQNRRRTAVRKTRLEMDVDDRRSITEHLPSTRLLWMTGGLLLIAAIVGITGCYMYTRNQLGYRATAVTNT